MSKRKSQTAVSDYIAEGFIREALVNYLALLGWATGTEEEVLSIDEIVERFDLDAVHKGGAVFDRERLEWLNGQWIRRLEPDDLIERLRPFVEADLAAGRIDVDARRTTSSARSLPVIPERLPTLGAIGDLVGFLWVRDLTYDPALLVPKRWDAATTLEALVAARASSPRPGPSRSRPTSSSRRSARWPRPRLEGRRPVHGDPRRGDRPDRDAAAVRHARRARPRADARATRPRHRRTRQRSEPDDPRRRPALARPLRGGLGHLRPGGDRRAVRRRGRVPLPAVGRADRRPRRDRRQLARDKDEPGSWAAHYDVWAFDGERASAIGESRYTNPDGSFRTLYHNHFALRFDGHGKCVEFVEYFMELPEKLRRPAEPPPPGSPMAR